VEWLITLVGTVATVAASIASLAYWLGKMFTRIEAKFAEIDRRFAEIDKRFAEIDKRFEHLESRLERLARVLVSCSQSMQCLLIDFMTLKGLFTKEERDFLIRELERVGSAHLSMLNPLKPEEARFILEVAQELKTKDPKEFDLRKLDKIIEIGQRWLLEDGHPDAARLILIAYTLKAILRKERGEL